MASIKMASLLRLQTLVRSPATVRAAGFLASLSGPQRASAALRLPVLGRPALVRLFSEPATDEEGLPRVDGDEKRFPPLYYKLRGQLKESLASGDAVRATVLRAIFNEVDYRTSGGRRTLVNDAHLAGLMNSILTRSQEAHEHFMSQGRQELADKEAGQITILTGFIQESGAQMATEQELRTALEEALSTNRPGMIPNVRWLKARVASILGNYMIDQEHLAKLADEYVPDDQKRYRRRNSGPRQ